MIESIGIVWGENYLSNFFKYSIGHFLSCKNIILIKEKKLNFNIIFKESEKNLVKKLICSNHIPFINQIYISDDKFIGNKYQTHTFLISQFIKKISNEKFIYLMYPDTIVSDNFFETLLRYINKNNFDLYFMPGLRTVIKNANLNFFERYKDGDLDSKTLTKFVYDNLHIKMKLMTINNEYFNNAPAWVIYNDPKGLIVKSYHLTPILIKNCLIKNKIDNKLVGIDDLITSVYLTNKIKFFSNFKKIGWCSYESEIIENFNSFKNNKNLNLSNQWIKNCVTKHQKKLYRRYTFYLSDYDKNYKFLKVKKIYIFIFEIKCFFKKIISIFFNIKNNYE